MIIGNHSHPNILILRILDFGKFKVCCFYDLRFCKKITVIFNAKMQNFLNFHNNKYNFSQNKKYSDNSVIKTFHFLFLSLKSDIN